MGQPLAAILENGLPDQFSRFGHCHVYRRSDGCVRMTAQNRKDYYKMALVIGKGVLHYSDRSIEVGCPSLILYNPEVAHWWEKISADQEGFCCIFTDRFLSGTGLSEGLRSSPIFESAARPVFNLCDKDIDFMDRIFRQMEGDLNGSYPNKNELLRHYILLILHHAQKLQPAPSSTRYLNASTRIASLFVELLERQFPIERNGVLQLKTPAGFADSLNVHVNHLNRAVKEVLGKTTTAVIAERIASEATALLSRPDHTVADVAFALGFEHPSGFNSFFKKRTGLRPSSIR